MSQKRTLEDWERAECAALKELVEAYNRERPRHERITQEAAGAALGITQGAFSNYLNARLALNKEIAAGISRLFRIPVEKFSRRLAAEIADMAKVVAPATPPEPARAEQAELGASAPEGQLTVAGLLDQLRLSPDGIPDPRLKAALINLLTQYQEDPNRGAEIAAAILTLTKKD